jgi:hypothetical protein
MTTSNRPLLITDCDEVLMHMVVPFGAWLAEDHGIDFALEDASFANALKRRSTGLPLEPLEVWPLLDAFFTHQMPRQTAVTGAAAALARLAAIADIVVLTNVGPEHAPARTAQLIAAGMPYPVVGSRGGKGDPVAALIAERAPSVALFIDDLPQHHKSVADVAPDVWRLHMVSEPVIAPKIPSARHAHARIDHWGEAEAWIAQRLTAATPAPATTTAQEQTA